MKDFGKLKLFAKDADDLKVLSSLLQDSLVPGVDMEFDNSKQKFIMVANRFCWEKVPGEKLDIVDGKRVHERRICAVIINHVFALKKRNWPEHFRDSFFNFLAINLLANKKGIETHPFLQIEFSDGPSLQFSIDKVNVLLVDLDLGHPTRLKPHHNI